MRTSGVQLMHLEVVSAAQRRQRLVGLRTERSVVPEVMQQDVFEGPATSADTRMG
jgi:hypothetical protein